MAYSAASIANSFLSRALGDKNAPNISPMKIQKLLYIAHGYYLVETDGEPLLDELFEAWKFGPVLPSLYHECKSYGYSGIGNYLVDIAYDGSTNPAPIPTDKHINDIIGFVWKEYGAWEATALSAWTHEKGGPWDKITKSGERILRNQDIPNDDIAEYFRKNLRN